MRGHDLREALTRAIQTVALAGAVACNSTSPTAPTNSTADISGIWNARIAGTQQRSGALQTDNALLALRQNDADVAGTIHYSGLSEAAELSGSLSNRVFTFTASQMLSPTCSATVRATVSLSAAGNQMTGDYRAVTCEDTVIGTLTATRR
jgi:hypothetical protein